MTTLSELVAETSQAVTGAKLRGAVGRKARLAGLEIPKDKPFAEFLAEVAPTAKIIRRPGSDMLVLPEDRQELLPTGPDFHIRRDLFEAFTIINSAASPWYDVVHDRVFWRNNDEPQLGGAINIPPATIESEVAVRRDFANGFSGDEQAALLAALEGPVALRSFSRTVFHHQLLSRWQGFRSHEIRSRLETWAKTNGLQWKDAWLVPAKIPMRGSYVSAASASEDPIGLLPALARLEPEDLRRIHIPLDIVAKLMGNR